MTGAQPSNEVMRSSKETDEAALAQAYHALLERCLDVQAPPGQHRDINAEPFTSAAWRVTLGEHEVRVYEGIAREPTQRPYMWETAPRQSQEQVVGVKWSTAPAETPPFRRMVSIFHGGDSDRPIDYAWDERERVYMRYSFPEGNSASAWQQEWQPALESREPRGEMLTRNQVSEPSHYDLARATALLTEMVRGTVNRLVS
ncbi:hypothetical protein FJZ40_04340 [Candidatus Shapirobacteria bacterium]|nr:hypothetical protein [Candidatus Shapirobacteria bacterium]